MSCCGKRGGREGDGEGGRESDKMEINLPLQAHELSGDISAEETATCKSYYMYVCKYNVNQSQDFINTCMLQ